MANRDEFNSPADQPANRPANPPDNGPHRVPLNSAQVLISGLGGIAFVAAGVICEAQGIAQKFNPILVTVGAGLFLAAAGLQVSGKIKSWNVAGGAAAALILLVLYYEYVPKSNASEPPVTGSVEGDFPENTQNFDVQSHDGTKLFGKWLRVSENYQFRMEKAHTANGCLSFTTFSRTENGGHDFATYIPAGYFAKFFQSPNDPAASTVQLSYKQFEIEGKPVAYLFADGNSEEPISRETCFDASNSTAMAVPTKGTGGTGLGSLHDLIFSSALAAEVKKLLGSDYIQRFKSENVQVRRSASGSLAKGGSSSVPLLMQALQAEPQNPKVQRGVSASLLDMMNAGAAPATLREQMSDKDIVAFTSLIGAEDETVRRETHLVLIYLKDPRANPTLLDQLRAEPEPAVEYSIAEILNANFPTFADPEKKRLQTELGPLFQKLSPDSRKLLDPVLEYQTAAAPEKGWIYLGTNFGSNWGEKYFENPTGADKPAKGDELKMLGNVNLRQDHIRFSLTNGGWKNAPAIGLVKSGDIVEVVDVKVIATGYYWAEIKVKE